MISHSSRFNPESVVVFGGAETWFSVWTCASRYAGMVLRLVSLDVITSQLLITRLYTDASPTLQLHTPSSPSSPFLPQGNAPH